MEAHSNGATKIVARPNRAAALSECQLARRRTAERVWIVLGIVWAVSRVFIAKATVEKYGVNIVVFAVIEIAVAWPHSLGAARVVTKLIDRDPHGALPWGLLLAVTHIGPELYIAVVGSNMPVGVYVSLAVIVVGLGALALIGIVQKVCAGRAERAEAMQAKVAARNVSEVSANKLAPLGDAALAVVAAELRNASEKVGGVDQKRVVPVVGNDRNGRNDASGVGTVNVVSKQHERHAIH